VGVIETAHISTANHLIVLVAITVTPPSSVAGLKTDRQKPTFEIA